VKVDRTPHPGRSPRCRPLRNGIVRPICPLVIGTVLGVMVIAHLDQRWMLPAIIAAIALSELAPWLAKRITKGSFQAASLATGAYAGFLGAGIGIIPGRPFSVSSISRSRESRT
jgi:uncharacterized membrane protein YfcA